MNYFIKLSITIAIQLLLTCNCIAQIKWQKVDKTFFQENSFTQYKSHPAIILNSEAVTHFVWNNVVFDIVTTYKYRYKILNSNGLKFANIAINYISENDYEQISEINGIVYNSNKAAITTHKLGKSNIYKQKSNNRTTLKMMLPNVAIGSVFEYSYTITKQSFSNISTFCFQEAIPVLHSVYRIYMPEYYTFNTKIIAPQSLKITKVKQNENLYEQNFLRTYYVTHYKYELKNLPKLELEPYQSSIKNEQYKIDFTILTYHFQKQALAINTNWNDIGKQMMAHPFIGQQLNKKLNLFELNDTLKIGKKKLDTINWIVKYINKLVKWNEIYDLYAISLKAAINEKEGNSATLNLLLLNQLQKYKLKAYPVIAATKQFGTVTDSFYSINQFNTIIAKVDTGNNQFAYIDMAQHNVEPFTLPENLLATNALVVENDTSVYSNFNNDQQSVCNIAINLQVDSNAIDISGYLNGNHYFVNNFQNNINADYLKNVFYSLRNVAVVQQSPQLFNSNNIFEVNFAGKNKISSSTNIIELSCNYFPFFVTQPFTQVKRNASIDFGFVKKYIVNINLITGTGLQIIAHPKAYYLKTENDELVLNINSNVEQNQLHTSFEFEINKPFLQKSDYEMVQQFFQILFDKINEPIVLQKK